jgi:hypothetical protein
MALGSTRSAASALDRRGRVLSAVWACADADALFSNVMFRVALGFCDPG